MKIKFKGLSLFLSLLMVLTCITAFSASAAVDSSAETVISTAQDLLDFAKKAEKDNFKGKTVVLASDIDMKDVKWEPIPDFAGTFDGKGHSIRNLTYRGTTAFIGGLFLKVTDATVKNLIIDGGEVSGTGKIGGIAGRAFGKCVFDSVYTSASVSSMESSDVGGILGSIPEAGTEVELINCIANGNVMSASNGAGSLVGYVEMDSGLTLTDCAFLGTCTGKNYSGGMVGYSRGNVTFVRCASFGQMQCAEVKAGFIAVYSDRAKTWDLANAARKEDPNADISAYVNKVSFVDCYYAQEYALYRHSNRYFSCFEFSVTYSDGSVEAELPAEFNGFTQKNPSSFKGINETYAKAFKKINKADFKVEDYALLTDWINIGNARMIPGKAFQMLENAGISLIQVEGLRVKNGAAVYMDEQHNGIRFTSTFSKEYYDLMVEKYGKANISFGTLIIEPFYVAGIPQVTIDILEALSASYTLYPATLRQAADGSYYFYGITEVKKNELNKEFAALAYLKVKEGDKETYQITGFDKDTVRSVQILAGKACEDVKAAGEEGYLNKVTVNSEVRYSPYAEDIFQLLLKMAPPKDPTGNS